MRPLRGAAIAVVAPEGGTSHVVGLVKFRRIGMMMNKVRALTEQQAKEVWAILVRCCGAREGVPTAAIFARLMSRCTVPIRWTFDSANGSAVFCAPEMRVIPRVSIPTGTWVAMLLRANEEIRSIVPAGAEIDSHSLAALASCDRTQAAASQDAHGAGAQATARVAI